MTEMRDSTPEIAAMTRPAKDWLARHIGEWHGHVRDVTPLGERLGWSRKELDRAHRELHERAAQ